jgi:hypothetical protein
MLPFEGYGIFICFEHRGGMLLVSVDGSVLNTAIDTVANIVYMGLSLIGAVAFLWGLGRKAWLNRWSAYQLPPANLPTV